MTTHYLPDRRAAVKGLALAAFMATPAVASSPTVDRSAWDAAVAAYDQALVAYDAAEIARERAVEAYRKELPSKPDSSFTHNDYEPRAEFDRKARELKERMAPWRAAEAALRKTHRVEELDAALNQASVDISDACDALLFMSAPDLAAVARKVELVVMEGIEEVGMRYILADIRRLGGLAA